ncbi:MAG: hypothetical protein ACLPX1_09730 [Steroidobacteraceae bacterium]
MYDLLNYPLALFGVSFLVLWFVTRLGAFIRKGPLLDQSVREEFNIMLAATLTLSGLIIGFSFSMAINRYEQRKNYEEAEANAIGTEYVRADLLPPEDAAKVRSLLRRYLDERLAFYTVREADLLRKIDAHTEDLQNELWAAVRGAASTQPTPIVALAVAGMNDVLNSQGYTQAAWWNRIPTGAWILMADIAVISQILIGYGATNPKAKGALYMVLPFVVSISFLLIADIDSPRSGFIHVWPQNLLSLAESLRKSSTGDPPTTRAN